MVYNQKLIVVIKVNGKVLRETGSNNDTVYLPFGSEYELYFKNLDSRRAIVSVFVDGQDALDGNQLIINGNNTLSLKRFMINGNLHSGPTFKFVEKSGTIAAARNDKIEDGLIRIEYQFENKPKKTTITHEHHVYHDYYPRPTWVYPVWMGSGAAPDFTSCDKSVMYGGATNTGTSFSAHITSRGMSIGGQPVTTTSAAHTTHITIPEVTDGFTVKGQEVAQQFHEVHVDPNHLDPEKHVIVLCLKGKNEAWTEITQVVTTKKKIKCSACGKMNQSSHKFCTRCGNNLEY